jgi:hypothetical protein
MAVEGNLDRLEMDRRKGKEGEQELEMRELDWRWRIGSRGLEAVEVSPHHSRQSDVLTPSHPSRMTAALA